MIHYPHNEEREEIKKYSKGIDGIIERFFEVIKILIFIFVELIVTFSFYWLIHWIFFGKNIYSDIFNFIDKIES